MREMIVGRRVAATEGPNGIRVGQQRAPACERVVHTKAVSRALRGIAGMVCRSIRTIAMQPLRRAVRRRAETQALLSMNDRVLADIGLLRADLQGMAYGIIPAGQGTPEPAREPALAIDLAAERPALALTDRLCEAA